MVFDIEPVPKTLFMVVVFAAENHAVVMSGIFKTNFALERFICLDLDFLSKINEHKCGKDLG